MIVIVKEYNKCIASQLLLTSLYTETTKQNSCNSVMAFGFGVPLQDFLWPHVATSMKTF